MGSSALEIGPADFRPRVNESNEVLRQPERTNLTREQRADRTMSDPNSISQPAGRECFAGNGEMAARMQSFDWSKTPVGPVESWPQSLKTTVRIMLTSRYAMWMAWGPELTFFYNDAYTPTLGIKHTWALGSRASKVWAEIWPDIGPRIESVLTTGAGHLG